MSEDCQSTKINNACHQSRDFENYVNCKFTIEDSHHIARINKLECYHLPRVQLYATQQIKGGEELLLDYGREYQSP